MLILRETVGILCAEDGAFCRAGGRGLDFGISVFGRIFNIKVEFNIKKHEEPEAGRRSGIGPYEGNRMTTIEENETKVESRHQRLEEAFRAEWERVNEWRKERGFPSLEESAAKAKDDNKRFGAVLKRVLETGKLERFDF
jgi:hypothetical protein